MPRGRKQPEPTGKIVYLDCPLLLEMYAPEEPEVYLGRAARAFLRAFDELEAKGLMPPPNPAKKEGRRIS